MMQSLLDAARVLTDVAWLLRSERWPKRRIEQYQRRRLVEQLRYAVREVPYYRALGIAPEEIRTVDDLRRFPKLDKATVQAESASLRNPSVMGGRVFHSTTSGSSGQPTTTWFDARSWLMCKYALKIRRTLAAGWPVGQRLLVFEEVPGRHGAVPPPKLGNYGVFREVRLSVFTPIEEQLAVLARVRPTVIYGSPSGVKELCDHAARTGVSLPPVRTVFLASELIGEELRRRIQAQLRASVIGIYGSTEFKEVAHECRHGRYHLNFESVYLETEPEAGQECPRLLITSLVNKAMPLIRFDIGDYARLGDDPCPCGREAPYLTDIAGREAEFLELPDGRRISPYALTTAIETTPALVKYRFVQQSDGGLDLEVVLSERFGPTEGACEELHERLRRVLGEEVEVDIRRVETIARTAAGKHKVVAQARPSAAPGGPLARS